MKHWLITLAILSNAVAQSTPEAGYRHYLQRADSAKVYQDLIPALSSAGRLQMSPNLGPDRLRSAKLASQFPATIKQHRVIGKFAILQLEKKHDGKSYHTYLRMDLEDGVWKNSLFLGGSSEYKDMDAACADLIKR